MKSFALAAIILTSSTAAQTSPAPEPIHGQGCVAAGVEMRCLVVKDTKTGTLYNLLFKTSGRAKPTAGTAIDFTGVPYKGVTTCMQGAALQVSSWTSDKSLKCAPGAPKP